MSSLDKFINDISKTFSIPKKKLRAIYDEVEEKVNLLTPQIDSVSLETYTKPQLVNLCKDRKIPHTGNKEELKCRLLGKSVEPSSKKPRKQVITKAKRKLFEEKELELDVIKGLLKELKPIIIKKNKNNHFEHVKSHLIFDEVSRKAIGRENKSGKVIQLNDDDIAICKKYGFSYEIPENLDKYNKKLKIKIEELDDGEEIDEEVVDEDEEIED